MSNGSNAGHPIYISIEGLVGSGKTTLKHAIVPHLRTVLGMEESVTEIDEPVNAWIASGILEKSYVNPREWAFPAQCTFFHTRIAHVRKARASHPQASVFLSERSPYSDTLFWELQKRTGRVDPMLHQLYYDMWTLWQDLMPADMQQPTLFVYLRPTLDTCMGRMRARARKEESSVTETYQEQLMALHDQHFLQTHVTMPNGARVPVLTLDTDENFRDDPQVARDLAQRIARRITDQNEGRSAE